MQSCVQHGSTVIMGKLLKTMLRLAEQTDGAPLKVVQDQSDSPHGQEH